MYIDESGSSSLKDMGRYFVLTGVMGQVSDFQNAKWYYQQLKTKYFGFVDSFHTVDICSNGIRKYRYNKARLLTINRYKRAFIDELSMLIDSIPFVYTTCSIDKDKLRSSVKLTNIRNPHSTNLNMLFKIWSETCNSRDYSQFANMSVGDALTMVKAYKIKDMNYTFPLELSVKHIVGRYVEEYLKMSTGKGSRSGEICFESSSSKIKTMEILERIYNDVDPLTGKESSLAKEYRRRIYSVSFANKRAKYLGTELADIISYGYNLKLNKRLKSNELYKPLWDKIQKRRKEIKDQFTCYQML